MLSMSVLSCYSYHNSKHMEKQKLVVYLSITLWVFLKYNFKTFMLLAGLQSLFLYVGHTDILSIATEAIEGDYHWKQLLVICRFPHISCYS